MWVYLVERISSAYIAKQVSFSLAPRKFLIHMFRLLFPLNTIFVDYPKAYFGIQYFHLYNLSLKQDSYEIEKDDSNIMFLIEKMQNLRRIVVNIVFWVTR